MRRVTACLVGSALLAVFSLGGCPGAKVPGGVPGGPNIPGHGSKASSVDPNTCGNYAASDAGAKLKAFLEATVALNQAVVEVQGDVTASCKTMAEKLGSPTEGDTKTVCNGVADAIRNNLKVGIKGSAALKVNYKPAVCTVKADVAADAAAKCEGSANANVKVQCTGQCQGTCSGTCDGTCKAKGAKGQCNGQCKGQCNGSCSGSCQGAADVDASAECKASAEIHANVEADCTEPELNITYDSKVVVNKPKVQAVVNALKAGLPKLIQVGAKLKSPMALAIKDWAVTAKDLAGASGKLYASLGDQASCVAGQLAAAAGMVAQIQGSVSVSVEASASVSGAASGSAGG